MFEFTCPKCEATNQAKTIENGSIVGCQECTHPLRVTSKDGEFSRGKKTFRWSSPLVAGFGGIAGLAVASVVMVIGFANRPANAVERASLHPIEEWARPKEDKVKEPPTPVAPTPTGEEVGMTGEQISKRLLKSVCWILAEENQGGKVALGSGSGTLIDRNQRFVITNEHVANDRSTNVFVLFPIYRGNKLVADNKAYMAEYRAGRAIKAKVVRVEARRDLTLLELETIPEGVVSLRLAAKEAERGQRIHTLGGNPRGNQGQWIHSDGTVRAVNSEKWMYDDGIPREAQIIASTVPINQGDSGGGAVNDRCQLVGVNNAFGGGNSNFRHISLPEVVDFVSAHYKAIGKEWNPPKDDAVAVVVVKDVSRLVGDLGSADKADKIKAANELKDLGPKARKAIPALIALACNQAEGEDVREAAMGALEEMGAPGHDELLAVMEALKETNPPEVRRYAAGALGPLAPKKADAAGALLMTARSDKDAGVREVAIASLAGVVGKMRETARPILLKLLTDAEKVVRRRAFFTLAGYGDPDPAQIDFAREKKNLADSTVSDESRWYSCCLVSLSEQDEVPTLCKTLVPTTEAGLANLVLYSLETKGAKTREVDQALTRALKHKDARVRVRAGQALVRIGYDAILFPAFLEAAGSSDRAVYSGPIRVLVSVSTWSTFDKKEVPALNLTKDALDSIKSALEGKDEIARRLAAYALGSMGAEGAVGVPHLRTAMKKEAKTESRLEMLTALSRIGPAAIKELSDQGETLLDELLEIAREGRGDTKHLQVCAALALARIAPESSQGKLALPVLAKAILLKDAARAQDDEPPRGRGFLAPPMRRNPKTPHPIELELHERARTTLGKGKRDAADVLANICYDTFFAFQTDTAEVKSDKRHARKTTCEVLAKIGPVANGPPYQKLLKRFHKFAGANQEYPDVIDAVKEMRTAISAKADKK
jgi:S1-C subfamily serine protease/HEAT repeat protein